MTYNKNDWESHDLITTGKMNNIEDGIQTALDRATFGHGGAEMPSEGLHIESYINLGDPMPPNPLSGDIVYVKDGDDYIIYQYDGAMWVLQVNPKFAQRLQKNLLEAKAQTETLISENQVNVDKTINEVKEEQKNLQDGLNNLDTNAQDYANKALADARADIATTAQDLAEKVQQETDDRVKAVSDATAHADNIVATAKSDLANTIAKETSDRNAAVTALDTKAKGYANTAKADAIAAANGAVAKEVTDRQKAITDLDAKATGVINQAKTDAQSALNALQVGGRNLVIKDKLVNGWMNDGVVVSGSSAHAMTTDFVAVVPNSSLVAQIWYDNTINTADNYLRVAFYDSNKTYITRTPLPGTGSTTYNKWLITTPANTAFVRVSFDWLGDGYGHAKLEIGNKATDYTQAPEDIVLDYMTKDNVIRQSLTQYQATNDGNVSKAQSDATQALGLVATKVSQTDYNTKTGDLDSKYTSVKQTVDTQTTDIADIKKTNTSQDAKLNTIQSDVNGTKQSISDIQTEQGKQSTKINTIQTDVSGTKQEISDIKDANGVQDGKIASISTTVDGLSSSFSTYKTTNDGKVAKAQADITANATAISQKVSQTAYDAKTGQLQTDLNTTTTTANQAKTDIVAIKSDNTAQDARMTTIESDANGTKTTVSNLQTDLGKANGSISTLQQRADGFDATVTKVNNLSIGGRNLLLKSKALFGVANNGNSSTNVTFDDTTNMWHITSPAPVTAGRGIYFYQTSNTSKPLVKGDKWAMSIDIKGTGMLREFGAEGSTNQTQPTGPIPSEWTRLSSTGTAVSTGAIIIYFGTGADKTQALDVYVKLPKLELGTIATAWSPAPEDLEGATAKAQLTADNATTTINNYKTSNDGRVATAESNISQNATAITQKVSQTDYDQKTGQLQTDLNTTTNTANTAKQDIATIKTDNTTRDSKINTLESDSTETKRTISQLSGDLNTVSGDVSTLKQTAQGFEATVTKVNNMSVGGGVNLLQGTGTVSGDVSQGGGALTKGAFNGYDAVKTNTAWNERYINLKSALGRTNTKAGDWYTISVYVKADKQIDTGSLGVYRALGSVDANTNDGGLYGISMSNKPITTQWQQYSWSFQINNVSLQRQSTRVEYNNDTSDNWIYWAGWVLEKGIVAHDWSPAPEDVDSSISSVKQTADSASTAITNYKVSNDGRVSAAEGNIKTNADAITQKVSVVDYNANNGTVSTRIGKVETANDKITQSVSSLTTQVNAMGQINQLFNTEFSPDFAGWGYWDGDMKKSTSNITNSRLVISNRYKGSNKMLTDSSIDARYVTSTIPISISSNQPMVARVTAESDKAGSTLRLHISFHDANGIQTGNVYTVGNLTTTPQDIVVAFNGPLPPNTVSAYLVVMVVGKAAWTQPMVIYGDTIGAYTPGAYNSTQKIASQQITIDSISDVVSNPATGLSKRVQTAEGTLNQVQGTDIPALQKATYWQPYGSLDLNTYTKQGSFFFNTTEVKPNGPTTMTNWMYLVVEQGTSDSGRVVQTAWYDTQTDAKITYRRQYAGAWSPWYANDNDSVTSISQTNGAIQQEVKDRTNGDSNTLTQAKNFTTSAITSSEKGMMSQITQTSDAILGKVGAVNLFPNSEFEKDYGYSSKNGNTVLSLGSKHDVDGKFNGVVWVSSTASAYQGYWARNIPVYGGQSYSMSTLVHYTNGGLSNGHALLDVWFVDKDGNRISKRTIGTGGSNVFSTGQVSSPYWVKLYIENVIAPTNAVNMQVSLLVNDAGTGQAAAFAQPMVTATEKLQTYTPNNDITTQLALLKDNWSIGINDNVGKLASGIAGDANAMAVVSPKVIINSPQTQITGKLTAAQIDTKELSALSANLGNVSSGSITNPINQAWSAGTGATLLGTTVIDNRGINMNADIKTASNPKLYSETVSISPDTGIKFSWRDYTGGTVLPPVPLDMSMSSAGIVASSGKQYVSILGNSITADNEIAGTATTMAAMASNPDGGINAGGAQSSAYIRYVHGQMDTNNLPLVMGFERIGNVVMVSFNFITYGSTIQADHVIMNGPKIPVGFRPLDNVHIMANANVNGDTKALLTFTIRPDGEVEQTSPYIGSATRMMGTATYMTYMGGAQAGFIVKDALGNTVW